MRDIWEEQLKWVESGEPFVLARVIHTWRSAPRKSGAPGSPQRIISNKHLLELDIPLRYPTFRQGMMSS